MMQRLPFSLFLSLCLLGTIQPVSAQLTGQLVDEAGAPVIAANVLLLRLPDTALAKGQVSDADGAFAFRQLKAGEYLLRVTNPGFDAYESEPIRWASPAQSLDLGDIDLRAQSVSLDEVEITAERQLFEQKIDRLVVNVSNSVTAAGNTALEVLERAPGVILDRSNGGISLAGKNGVVVMINGKRNYMPISGVIQMLAGMPADQIEKIELITTPPANFDAEGNAGYINIVLKENSNYGLNGSLSASLGYGRGLTSNDALSLNYRRNKINLFGSYAFSLDRREQEFSSYREYMEGDELVILDTRSDRAPQQRNHNLRLGMDYQLSKKTVIGILAAGYDNEWTMTAVNNADFTYAQRPDTIVRLDNEELNHWQHLMGNVNVQHQFSPRSSLTVNADYLYYLDNNPTDYQNSYLDRSGNQFREEALRSEKLTPINIAVGAIDYKTPLGEKANLETGIKATLSRFTNDVQVRFGAEGEIIDTDLSGVFYLEEEIGAAYAAVDWAPNDKIGVKFGLRYEYTSSNLSSEEEADIVDRQYGNLFPSLFVSRQINQSQGINFSYSRRITRPTFNDMAPFVIFLDPQTFFSGNAALQPAISDAVRVDYRIKTLMFSLSYTHEDSSIANFQPRFDPETNRQLVAATNLRNTHTVYLGATLPIKITDWWEMQYNIGGQWSQVNSYLDGDLLTFEQWAFNGFGANRFQLPWKLGLELSGFYRSPRVFGTAIVLPIWSFNAGLRRSFGPNGQGGTLTFNVQDMFNSLRFRSEIDLPAYNLVTRGLYDFSQRTFSLSYTRNFGSNKVRAARQRNTASEEERQRVN